MALAALNQEIEQQLHDLSRTGRCVDPKDILEVVESVFASISGDHASLNHRLHADIEALANYINAAKAEISEIKADKINKEFLPEASDQLIAIVGATEQATNDIFEAVELIEELTEKMAPKMAERVTEAVTRVYEACSFQDITGQRVTKVVTALQNVEAKVHALLQAFGEESGAEGRETASETPGAPGAPGAGVDGATPASSDEDLMTGPQIPGEANSQDDIDALLASFD
ncbi:MAG: protein phosphatase CheZ [Proteobacteria bacterium]|nr:protein phosphatase CheZ [Pseudomonadota bacterium]